MINSFSVAYPFKTPGKWKESNLTLEESENKRRRDEGWSLVTRWDWWQEWREFREEKIAPGGSGGAPGDESNDNTGVSVIKSLYWIFLPLVRRSLRDKFSRHLNLFLRSWRRFAVHLKGFFRTSEPKRPFGWEDDDRDDWEPSQTHSEKVAGSVPDSWPWGSWFRGWMNENLNEKKNLYWHVNVNDPHAMSMLASRTKAWANDWKSIARKPRGTSRGRSQNLRPRQRKLRRCENATAPTQQKETIRWKYTRALRGETALTFARQMEFDTDVQSMLTSCYRAEILPRASI